MRIKPIYILYSYLGFVEDDIVKDTKILQLLISSNNSNGIDSYIYLF